jgi:hypothetical protein
MFLGFSGLFGAFISSFFSGITGGGGKVLSSFVTFIKPFYTHCIK